MPKKEKEDYTNVLNLLEAFCRTFEVELIRNSMMGSEPWTSMLGELREIFDLLNDPAISEPLDNSKLSKVHPVDRYGLGEGIIALHEQGLTAKEIVENLSNQGFDEFNEGNIRKWLREYNSTPITNRSSKVAVSVFDTQTQLQSLFETLQDLMDGLEDKDDETFYRGKTTKEQVRLQHIQEIRQTVKDAASLAATIAGMQQMETFKKLVIEEVNKENPAVAARIWKKIRDAKVMFTSFNLGNSGF